MLNIPLPFIGKNTRWTFFLKSKAAYEHRFGTDRCIGLYTKIGTCVPVAGGFDGNFSWGPQKNAVLMDGSVGFQELLSKEFSIVLESWIICLFEQGATLQYGGKGAPAWQLQDN